MPTIWQGSKGFQPGKRTSVESEERSSAIIHDALENSRGTTVQENKGLFVDGTLESEMIRMTIDTGSNISIISPRTLGDIGLNQSNVQPVNNNLKTVTGEQMYMSGRIILKLGLGGKEILQNFWVADISENCILGLDFLEQQGRHLDIVNETLTFGNVRVPLFHLVDDSTSFLCYRVVAAEDVYIQPRIRRQ